MGKQSRIRRERRIANAPELPNNWNVRSGVYEFFDEDTGKWLPTINVPDRWKGSMVRKMRMVTK